MAAPNIQTEATYAADGRTAKWRVPFPYAKATDVGVKLIDSEGLETELALGTDYMLQGPDVFCYVPAGKKVMIWLTVSVEEVVAALQHPHPVIAPAPGMPAPPPPNPAIGRLVHEVEELKRLQEEGLAVQRARERDAQIQALEQKGEEEQAELREAAASARNCAVTRLQQTAQTLSDSLEAKGTQVQKSLCQVLKQIDCAERRAHAVAELISEKEGELHDGLEAALEAASKAEASAQSAEDACACAARAETAKSAAERALEAVLAGVGIVHPEYLRLIVDKDGRALFGIRLDGTVEWAEGVPEPVREFVEKHLRYAWEAGGQDALKFVDAEGRLLFGVKNDGRFEWSAGIPRHVREFVERNVKNAFIPGCQDVMRVADAGGRVLLAIGADGRISWAEGIPAPVKAFMERHAKAAFVPQGGDQFRVVDAAGKFLFGVRADGSFDWAEGIPAHVREYMDRRVSLRWTPGHPAVQAVEDSAGRAVSWMDGEGRGTRFGDQAFIGDVKVSGSIDCDRIKGVYNWTHASAIKIPELPRCAVVNIKGFSRPLTKADERHAVMEFWDGRGNYFEKNILIGLQGNSTWNLPKPNYKFDVIKHGWNDVDEDGDPETCEIQFGDWVPSDSFHLKAFWTDFTKCRAIVSYKVWEEICKTYPMDRDATWKRAMLPADAHAPLGELPAFSCTHDMDLRLDSGATCRFDAFPCLVYHNGKFYGIFAFQQKKQRQNFMMDKKNFRHIHLDGFVAQSLCAGAPDYGSFEIRNPKKLVCWDGSDYDGDAPMRLVNRGDAEWKNKSKFTNTEITDLAIRAIAGHLVEIGAMDKAIQAMIANEEPQADIDAAVASLKQAFETYFDPENVIDMVVHLTWDNDTDSTSNNTQWTTWDGVKWYLNRYDANGAFEGNSRWHSKPGTVSHVMGGTAENHPFHIVEAYYFDEACARYAELRNAGILDADHFMAMVQDWMLAVGADFYKKEFEMWPTQNCLGEPVANSACWQLVLDGNGKPIRCDVSTASPEDQALPTFNLNATYQPGDVVKASFTYWYRVNQAQSHPTGYWKMECVAPGPCRGIPPFDTRFINAPDSVYRLYSWIRLRQEKVDAFFGYES